MSLMGSSETGVKNRQISQAQISRTSHHILDIEIDREAEQACSSGLCDIGTNDIPLFKYTDIPHYLQGNPYVVHGYRVTLPFSLCLKSMFIWSNETINIWSHLLGFFAFLLLTLYDNLIQIPRLAGGFSDHFVVTTALLCFQFCMLCSTGFHLFGCHSERATVRWLSIDMTGISMGIIGCYLPAVHYAFYCLSIWRDVYFIIISLLILVTLCMQLHPRFFSHKWFYIRISIYVALVAYGVIPTMHWIYLNNGWNSRIVQIFVPKVITMYMLGMLAFAFYISKFPERFFPGRLDYVGSSHQIWHVGIATCLWYWRICILDIMSLMKRLPCVL